MINLLGPRIVFVILISMLVCAGAGSGLYYYLIPEQEQSDTELRTLRGQINTKRQEIAQLKQEYELLKEQIVQFNILKKKGFFNAQDRVTARETIAELTAQAKLLQADLSLPPANIEADPAAEKASHILIGGPMTLKISAMSDQNIFKYMVALQNIFPGYLEFENFDFRRRIQPGLDPIQAISEGKTEATMGGELKFKWWSMASPAQMAASPYFNPTAVASPAPMPTPTPAPAPTGTGGTP